jgi:hypothetical protein
MLITCWLLIAPEATVPFISFFFDNPESPDRCHLMGPPRKLPASVPSAPLLAVRDGEEGHDEVEEVDALAAIRSGLPWKGPCPVLMQVSCAAVLGTGV